MHKNARKRKSIKTGGLLMNCNLNSILPLLLILFLIGALGSGNENGSFCGCNNNGCNCC